MEKIKLNRDENDLPEEHPLNQNLEIPFMEAGGAYHIIADICGLSYIGNGIFTNQTGRKFILTKFGFEHCQQYNYHIKYAETIIELRKLRSDHEVLERDCERKIKASIRNLEEQVRAKNEKIKNQAEAVRQHREKIDSQSEQIKNQAARIKELYALLSKNGINWR